MRVLTATGIEELDRGLARHLSEHDVEIAGECYYREALLSLAKERGAGVVVLSTHLPGRADMVDVVKDLRMAGLRVVLLPGRRDDSEAVELARQAVALGVYDVVWDPVSPGAVAKKVLNPATLADAGVEPDENVIDVVKEKHSNKKSLLQNLTIMFIKKNTVNLKNGIETAETKQKKSLLENRTGGGLGGDDAEESRSGVLRRPKKFREFFNRNKAGKPSIKGGVFQPQAESQTVKPRSESHPASSWEGSGAAFMESGRVGEVALRKILNDTEERQDVYIDYLTGCRSRRYLNEKFNLEGRYSVVFIDLDNFKPVNDILGHEAGDRVLAAFGKMLVENLKGQDIAVRWGGDEFVLVLPDTASRDAEAVVENLRAAWEKAAPRTGGLKVGFSAGVAEGRSAADFQKAVKEADRLMYAAKKTRKAKEAWGPQKAGALPRRLPERRGDGWPAAVAKGLAVAADVAAVAGAVSALVWAADYALRALGGYSPYLREAAGVVEWFWKMMYLAIFG